MLKFHNIVALLNNFLKKCVYFYILRLLDIFCVNYILKRNIDIDIVFDKIVWGNKNSLLRNAKHDFLTRSYRIVNDTNFAEIIHSTVFVLYNCFLDITWEFMNWIHFQSDGNIWHSVQIFFFHWLIIISCGIFFSNSRF